MNKDNLLMAVMLLVLLLASYQFLGLVGLALFFTWIIGITMGVMLLSRRIKQDHTGSGDNIRGNKNIYKEL